MLLQLMHQQLLLPTMILGLLLLRGLRPRLGLVASGSVVCSSRPRKLRAGDPKEVLGLFLHELRLAAAMRQLPSHDRLKLCDKSGQVFLPAASAEVLE